MLSFLTYFLILCVYMCNQAVVSDWVVQLALWPSGWRTVPMCKWSRVWYLHGPWDIYLYIYICCVASMTKIMQVVIMRMPWYDRYGQVAPVCTHYVGTTAPRNITLIQIAPTLVITGRSKQGVYICAIASSYVEVALSPECLKCFHIARDSPSDCDNCRLKFNVNPLGKILLTYTGLIEYIFQRVRKMRHNKPVV